MTKRNVIVAHPGQQHSYQTALAMQEAQLLEVYLTGFYYKPDFTAAAILKVLPGRLKQVALRELGRRHLGALNPEKINSHPILELAQVLAGRLRQSNDRLLLYRNWNFQKWAGRILAKRCPSAVIAYDTSVLELFKSAKAIGALRILDQTIADRRLGLQLMRDEALLHPEWAESLTFEHMQKTEALTHAEAEAADVIIAGSEFVRTSLIERGVSCAKIAVLPYGAEENSVRPTSRVDNSIFKIVFAGSVGQRKGIKYLLEAVRRLGLPNLRLDVVGSILGDPKQLEPYREFTNFCGNVPRREVTVYLANADIFVYPSLFEGSALAIYEALAAGLPVITTPNSGSVVRHGVEGYIVPIRDIETLARTIKLLYDDPILTRRLSANARLKAREFTWQRYRKRLGAFVTHVIEAKHDIPAQLEKSAPTALARASAVTV